MSDTVHKISFVPFHLQQTNLADRFGRAKGLVVDAPLARAIVSHDVMGCLALEDDTEDVLPAIFAEPNQVVSVDILSIRFPQGLCMEESETNQ
jgi:hypothetical protein